MILNRIKFTVVSFILFTSSLLWVLWNPSSWTSTSWTTSGSSWSPSKSSSVESIHKNTDLVSYVYFETDEAKHNLQFFLDHALHDAADFLFIINGDSSIEIPTNRPNVRVVYRNNTCYDLGSQKEVLESNDSALLKAYERFLWINASIRGPFFPRWSESPCWTNRFFNRLSNTTKLVGMTLNCKDKVEVGPDNDLFWLDPHVQSMLLVFDRTSAELVLSKLKCYDNMKDVVFLGEYPITGWVREAGYEVDVLMSKFSAKGHQSYDEFAEQCKSGNLFEANYDGMNIHPFDSLFAKTNRDLPTEQKLVVDTLTQWVDQSQFSSFDYC